MAATENNFSVAFNIAVKENDSIRKQLAQAKTFLDNKQTEQALKLYLQIVETAKATQNKPILIQCNLQISKIFRSIKNYNKALFYAKTSLLYALKEKDTLSIIESNQNIGTLHFKLYASDSISYPQSLDSLFYYNNIVSNTIDGNPKYNKQQAYQYSSLSVAKFYKKQYLKANNLIYRALQIQTEIGDTIGQVLSLNTLASNYLQRAKYTESKKYYNQAISLIEKSHSDRKDKISRMLYSNLAWAYYKTKDYIAYEYLSRANKIANNLRDAEFEVILTEIEAKHNVDIIKQNAAKKQLIEIQKKKRFQLITLALTVCLFILIFVFWIYSKTTKLKDENKDLLILKTRLMKEKEIESLESLTRIKILNATLDGKEMERKQIAETLHDNVSALLSAANLHLQATKNKLTGGIPIEIDKTQKIIEEASGKIRNLSHELISSVLLKFGLGYAIQDLSEKYSNDQLEISASTENLQRYKESFEIKINNIIEELVNNLIKHSKATEGRISAMEYQKKLYVEIQDNGIGFDTSKKTVSDGIGIHQIKARIKMMKGDFQIHSTIEEGTNIEIIIPITYKSDF